MIILTHPIRKRSSIRSPALLISLIALILSGCALATPEPTPTPEGIPFTGMTPSITIANQEVEEGRISILEVVAAVPGWVVVHADENGAPGPTIGIAQVEPGVNRNIRVEIDPTIDTDLLHIRLHVDEGTPGEFEYPGPDVPVQINGQIVVETIHVTGVVGRISGPAVILIQDSDYSPFQLTIVAGTTVTWRHEGSFTHTVTSNNGILDSGPLEFGDEYQMTFTQPGTYYYHCQLHGGPGGQGMSGAIIVEPQ